MGGIVHRAILRAAFAVALEDARPFLPRGAGQPMIVHLAQVAAGTVETVEIFAFAVDEVAERALRGLAAAIHRPGVVIGGLTEHIAHAGAAAGLDQAVAPVERLVVIRDADHRHGAVDVLAALHRLNRLRRVQPVLGDDHQRVQIARADLRQ